MGRSSGGGGRGGGAASRAARVAIEQYGGRARSDGTIALSSNAVENAIGFDIRYRRSGSVDRAVLSGQTIPANAVGSVRAAVRDVTLTGTQLNVRRVGGQAYVQTAFSEGINRIASNLGATVNWSNR